MEESIDPKAARTYIRAILDGRGMTVFTKRVKKDLVENAMTSLDAVNVLRGGKISPLAPSPSGWRYQAATLRMTVEFSFRGQERGAPAPPNELVLETARRIKP
jgi:hypothetical protein